VSTLDPVQLAARPKVRYKRAYRRLLGERETIKSIAVSPIDAAIMLGISRASVYNLLKTRALPAYKLEARTLILVSDLKKFLSHLPRYESGK
jgi:Helix-turn-helix domain